MQSRTACGIEIHVRFNESDELYQFAAPAINEHGNLQNIKWWGRLSSRSTNYTHSTASMCTLTYCIWSVGTLDWLCNDARLAVQHTHTLREVQ